MEIVIVSVRTVNVPLGTLGMPFPRPSTGPPCWDSPKVLWRLPGKLSGKLGCWEECRGNWRSPPAPRVSPGVSPAVSAAQQFWGIPAWGSCRRLGEWQLFGLYFIHLFSRKIVCNYFWKGPKEIPAKGMGKNTLKTPWNSPTTPENIMKIPWIYPFSWLSGFFSLSPFAGILFGPFQYFILVTSKSDRIVFVSCWICISCLASCCKRLT